MPTLNQPTLRHVAKVHATLLPPEAIGKTAAGTREMIVITGGTIEGSITGTIIPGGADWALNHDDGTATIWARYAIRCNDGSLIMVTNSGVLREHPDGSWRGHTSPAIESGTPGLAWLNSAVLVGTLHAEGDSVHMEWWQVV